MYDIMEKAGAIVDFMFFTSPSKKGRIMTGGENPVFERYRKEMGRQKFDRFMYYLKRSNYIKVDNVGNNKAVVLTKKGLFKALRIKFKKEDRIEREDGKWIMVIFDIPKNNAKARYLLRSILVGLGYKLFQQSVWVCPYEVSEKTEALLQIYSLDKYVKIFLIEKI